MPSKLNARSDWESEEEAKSTKCAPVPVDLMAREEKTHVNEASKIDEQLIE